MRTAGLDFGNDLVPKQPVYALARMFGLGDVLMALCAAKAMRHEGAWVLLITDERYREIAQACPQIGHVVCSQTELESVRLQLDDHPVSLVQLGSPEFAIVDRHQIDAYLTESGITQASPEQKQLDIELPPSISAKVETLVGLLPAISTHSRRILIHPGGTDPNRTWPQERWEHLARTLIADGHQVIRIGAGQIGDARRVQDLRVAGVVDLANRLSLLETIGLMRHSQLLVSTDGGPIQLAAATDIGIVGIYSVVAGRNRLPYRHGKHMWRTRSVEPSCRFSPCYRLMRDTAVMAPYIERLRAGTLTSGQLLSKWCVRNEPFRCMTGEIGVDHVFDACKSLLDEI